MVLPRVMGQARVERRMSDSDRFTRYELLTVLKVADLKKKRWLSC